MSRQRGKGDRRKYFHKDGRKHHDNAKQHSMKFDEERFLRDVESALDRMALHFYASHWLYTVVQKKRANFGGL